MFNSLKRYFCFNKSERIALFLFLLLLLFIKSFVHIIYDKKEKAFYEIIDQKIDWVAVDSAHIQSKSIENNKDIIASKIEEQNITVININKADSFDFRDLPGIGVVYSSRIVRYRNLLGGFYKKEQLLDVYGIDSVLLQGISSYLIEDDTLIRRININRCDIEELSRHPYVSYKLAKLIVKYRKHHGFYSSIEDLKKIPLVDDELLRKIALYFEL